MPQLFNHGHGWETLEQIKAREARENSIEIQSVEKENTVPNLPIEAENTTGVTVQPEIINTQEPETQDGQKEIQPESKPKKAKVKKPKAKK